MPDIAELGYRVDSSQLAKGTRALDANAKAAGRTEKATEKLERQANRTGKAIGRWLGGLVTGYAVTRSVQFFIRQADAMANMNAKLKLVTGSTQAATKAQKDLFNLSQRTSSDLEATTDLYVKLGQSNRDLAKDSELLLGITEKVSKALVISGADAAASSAVIRQFSQAMGAGALRGDEFISVMEGAPRLAQAIADGMGVATGSLRKLAEEGKLTADTVINALEDQGAVLDREFSEMPLTVSRATQQVRNALTQLIGDTDDATGASADLAKAIEGMARTLESDETKRGFAAIVGGIASIVEAISGAIPVIVEFNDKLLEGFGINQKGATRSGNIADFFGGNAAFWKSALQGDFNSAANARIRAGLAGGQVVNFADVIGGSDTAFGNVIGGSDTVNPNAKKPASTSDGGGASKKMKELPDFAKDAAEELRKLLEIEASARHEFDEMAATLAGPVAEANFRYAVDLQRLRELASQGAIGTDQLAKAEADLARQKEETLAAIDAQLNPWKQVLADLEFEGQLLRMNNDAREVAIALRYANVGAMSAEGKAIAEVIRQQQEQRRELEYQIEITDGLRSATQGLFHDLAEGEGVLDSLRNAFGRFADALFSASVDKVVASAFGAQGDSGGGMWGNLLGSLFGGGREYGGDIRGDRMYRVGERNKPELARIGGNQFLIPGDRGRVEPIRESGGRNVTINQRNYFDRNNSRATPDQIAYRTGREAQRAMARN